ncbi:DUF397 domain-containing protein [Streptomyces lavendulae]|uniref:DUF397 domain-containing protein n=1 Tax=Streptomyces lavendulae TaxID=1914 RepID=UPI00249FEC74|nr:DUF397 domain-containing protein [Streptomyces lavendulae]GLW00204.1 hypothetical protein Slala05_38350 [Streptomyces lavendulae subsp. lavendulae]
MKAESPRWFKSSYSDNGGACVEVATNLVPSRGVVPVRDSKHTDGPELGVTADAFSAFVDGLKAV